MLLPRTVMKETTKRLTEVEKRPPLRDEEIALAVKDVPSRFHHPLESIVKKYEGSGTTNNWKLVDWSKPISREEDQKFSCDFTQYERSELCVHSFKDIVSDHIRRNRHWPDCLILPRLWKENGVADDNSLYIEIGANIGSCVLEMLLSTNASVVAFEPHPMNVYNIKKTLSKLGKSYQDRLLLFPIGLGKSESISTIYSGSENMGNSQIGQAVKDWDSQTFDQLPVYIERLDSVLDATKIDKIRLVKMDAQGFECNVVDGMGVLAKKMIGIKFEHEPKFLHAQGCVDLVSRIRRLGFKVFKDNLSTEMTEDPVTIVKGVELYAQHQATR
ncbi:hypothetical protein HJC23_006157 [Cyclotella cryptica]|uniref:Methyltransferase FkbM domain-containing protein n=1 Tax=Cyclotella cryptica TaxID=29204 RepID=A0ABD3PAI2_9STRA